MDRGFWQATVHGVTKEPDDFVTKQHQVLFNMAIKAVHSMVWGVKYSMQMKRRKYCLSRRTKPLLRQRLFFKFKNKLAKLFK